MYFALHNLAVSGAACGYTNCTRLDRCVMLEA